MKMIFSIFFILVALFSGNPSARAEDFRLEGIPLGERLAYKITWLGIPVANGELWAKEKINLRGKEVFHIVVRVQTNQVMRKIFPMDDELHSWIDAKSFESVQFEKDIREIRIKAHEKIIFDSAEKKARYESFTTGKKMEFAVQTPVYDALSILYWVRQQKFVKGESVKTVFSGDKKEWNITVTTGVKETIKHHGDKIKTLRIEPRLSIKGKNKLGIAAIHLTEDNARTPLRIAYKAPFGSVVGTLKEPESPSSEA